MGAKLRRSAAFTVMGPMDELAEALRARLIERARAGRAAAATWPSGARPGGGEAAALADADRDALCERVLLLAGGLGPLEPLLADPPVDEVMVNGPGSVYVERNGQIEPRAVAFDSEASCCTPSSASSPRSGGGSTRRRRCATRGWPTARA